MNNPTHIFAGRLAGLACLCAVLAGFWYGPTFFDLGPDGKSMWAAVAGISGPLLATALCFVAAYRSGGSDRHAWRNFGAGSLLYFLGNLFYLYCAVRGITPSFPTLPEGAYFLMALFFARGMSQYGNVRSNVSRVQIYNFILIYSAISFACLFLLHPSMNGSALGAFGAIVAITYPALWLSVAAFGLISLFLYNQGHRRFPYILLLTAVGAEAIADFIYAQALMASTYAFGNSTQLLWVASAGSIAWAAVDAIVQGSPRVEKPTSRAIPGIVAQAAVPAVGIAILMLAASASGAFGKGSVYVIVSSLFGLAFAIVAGLREHWIIRLQRNMHDEVVQNQSSLSAVLEATSDSVVVVDQKWRITFFNENAARTLHEISTLKLGTNLWDAFAVGEESDFRNRLQASLANPSSLGLEQFVSSKGIWLSINAYPTARGASLFFRDISEQRHVHERLLHLAHHDSLTGLANRACFRQSLETGLAGTNDGGQLSIIFLDLDGFKGVNDTKGHPVGDTLLVEVAERLHSCVDGTDMVARMGGDEFAVLLRSRDDPGLLAKRIIASLSPPFDIAGQNVEIGASFGIAVAPQDGATADQLLKAADIALYAAKSEGRGTYRFFEPIMEERLTARQTIRSELATALGNGELEILYQPIIDLPNDRVGTFEALLRWRHPAHGVISPIDFIPVAEETGLIIPIGEWVLNQACLEAARWPGNVGVAVNLSAFQFRSEALPGVVAHALTQASLSPARLELEITESILLHDSEANLEVLRRLRALGVKIALDDFGTGYSSLAYLRKFRFTKIKIDRSFIKDLENEESRAIVRSVTQLGRALRMVITAEGVETRQQLDRVRSEGCSEAQGYFFSRPVTPLAILPLIEKLNKDSIWWADTVQGRWYEGG